jgi:nitrogen PTS system EIIA component
MHLTDLIQPDDVIASLDVPTKRQLLKALASRAAESLKIDKHTIIAALSGREVMGSTGVGQGVAIPHARIEGLGRFYSLFVRLDHAIDFASVDDMPVDLVFLLLTPASASGAEHMRALSAITRRLRDRKLAEDLRSTKEPKFLYDLLVGQKS